MRLRLAPALIVSVSLLTVASIAAIYTLISGAGPQPAVRVPTVAPAAMVDGVTISAAEMDAAIAPTLAKLQEQIYSARLTRLNTIIDDRLVGDAAKKRKVSPEAFLASELAGKAAPVSDAEIAAFFESNKAKLPGDLPKWQDQIRKYLSEQRQVDARASLIARLREDAHVKVMLDPPPVYRATVDLTGAPVRGAAAAPVTVVEFSDFHCPFCRQVQPVLRQLLQEYGDRLRIVYKDMPIDGLHPQARGVAEAARCAADQGRFWEFHDKVYAGGPDGSAATMQRYASEAGVELSQFESCRASRKHQAGVQRDVQEGADLGLTGTPGFFINGRFLSGSQPLEAFTRVIDQELAAGGTAGAR